MSKNPCHLGDYAEAVMTMVSWGLAMKREDDLLRDVLLEIEERPDPIFLFSPGTDASEQDRVKYYHMQLLRDAGYLEERGRHGGTWRMTNAGHDFLAITRTDAAWGAVKAAASDLGGASVRMLGEIAYGLAKEKLRALGLPLE